MNAAATGKGRSFIENGSGAETAQGSITVATGATEADISGLPQFHDTIRAPCLSRSAPGRGYIGGLENSQVDVKFLDLKTQGGQEIRYFQCTAIDDATRIRVLKIYERHTQQTAIDFVDYVIAKFPFRINTIRTDNGHEFQVKFHWHLEDLGTRDSCIKTANPRLNGKVECSHGADQREFYQLLSYTDDVDLHANWLNGRLSLTTTGRTVSWAEKTPYERLVEKMR